MPEFTYNSDDIFSIWFCLYKRNVREEDILFLRLCTGLPEDRVRTGFRNALKSSSQTVQQSDTESFVYLTPAEKDPATVLSRPTPSNCHAPSMVPLLSNDPQPPIGTSLESLHPSSTFAPGGLYYMDPAEAHERSTSTIPPSDFQPIYRNRFFRTSADSSSSGFTRSTNSVGSTSLRASGPNSALPFPSTPLLWAADLSDSRPYLESFNESSEILLNRTSDEFQLPLGHTLANDNNHNPEPNQYVPPPRGPPPRVSLPQIPPNRITLKSAQCASAREDRGPPNCTSAGNPPVTENLPKIYQCTFCGGRFPRKCDWNRHEQEQHEREEYWMCNLGDLTEVKDGWKCTLCPIVKPTQQEVADHLEHAHAAVQCAGKDPDEQHRFWRKTHLRSHLLAVHKLDEGTSDWKKWNFPILPKKVAWGCGYCGKLLSTWSNRIDHIAASHYEGGKKRCDRSYWNPSYVILGLLKRNPIKQALESKIHPYERHLIPRLEWTNGNAERLRHSLETFSGEIEQATELAGQALKMSTNARSIFKQSTDSSALEIMVWRPHEEDIIYDIPPSEPAAETCTGPRHTVQRLPHSPATEAHQSSLSTSDSSNYSPRMNFVFDTATSTTDTNELDPLSTPNNYFGSYQRDPLRRR